MSLRIVSSVLLVILLLSLHAGGSENGRDKEVKADGKTATAAEPELTFELAAKTPARFRLANGKVAYGDIDRHGDFQRAEPGYCASLMNLAATNDPKDNTRNGPQNFGTVTAAYEFRSGVLIPGSLRYPGRFVPTGGELISIDRYEPGGRTPPIYNLPGKFVKMKAGEKKVPYDVQLAVVEGMIKVEEAKVNAIRRAGDYS